MPCYGALFGPHLFGHGTHVEAHASFGRRDSAPENPRQQDKELLARQLKAYNQYHESSRTQIHSREVRRRGEGGGERREGKGQRGEDEGGVCQTLCFVL